jgi:hypothetical protein
MQSKTGRRLGCRVVRLAALGGFFGAFFAGVTTPAHGSTWRPVAQGPSARDRRMIDATLTASLSAPAVGIAPDPATGGYWEVASNGAIAAVNAPNFGSMGGQHLNRPIVGMAATPSGDGYREVASDGGIFSFGKARFLGSMGGDPLNEPIVGIADDPATGGYWEVASDGGVFSFDAPFLGSMGGQTLNSPVVGIVPSPSGDGYWEVAHDGGIFTFGNAAFHGSTGGQHLAAPIVEMTADPATGGYWEVASDGGIFSFDAPFLGSMGGKPLGTPVVDIAATPGGGGYREVEEDGAVFSFGGADSLSPTTPPQSADPPATGNPGPSTTSSGGTAGSGGGGGGGGTGGGGTGGGGTGGGGSTQTTTSPGTSNPPAEGYDVVGNEILEPGGRQFVPYGFVVNCLADKSLGCLTSTNLHPLTDSTLIRAAAGYWHADVIRIQVAPENLLSGTTVNTPVLNDLTSEVNLVNSLGMVAIITDQQEEYKGPTLPTASAVQFWETAAADFKGDPGVFFDLYNEPRVTLQPGSSATEWSLWRNGGEAATETGTYQFVGMQTLLDDIRAQGAPNIVVAEGLNGDRDLKGIPRYGLTGTNIAYGVEPDLTKSDDTPAEWASNWGDLSQSVPVMMEAFQDWPGAGDCNTASPTLLPQLLSYLQSMHLGMVAWALVPGVLMIGNDPDDPTTYQGTTTAFCTTVKTAQTFSWNTNGPGQLIHNWFGANSASVPTD